MYCRKGGPAGAALLRYPGEDAVLVVVIGVGLSSCPVEFDAVLVDVDPEAAGLYSKQSLFSSSVTNDRPLVLIDEARGR